MKVLVRADAGKGRGTGHVGRCATPAPGLRARGADAAFAWLQIPEAACERILSLPTFPGMSDGDAGRVIATVGRILKAHAA